MVWKCARTATVLSSVNAKHRPDLLVRLYYPYSHASSIPNIKGRSGSPPPQVASAHVEGLKGMPPDYNQHMPQEEGSTVAIPGAAGSVGQRHVASTVAEVVEERLGAFVVAETVEPQRTQVSVEVMAGKDAMVGRDWGRARTAHQVPMPVLAVVAEAGC
jgi:hypothetical protein